MNGQTKPPTETQTEELSLDDIQNVYSMLQLDKEEERQKFIVMAEAKRSDVECTRIWLSGTTAAPGQEIGGQDA